MSYIINRLEKSLNREGIEEIFINLQITDELGTYNFGKWLTQEQYDIIKFDLGDEQFNAWTNIDEYNQQTTMMNSLGTIVDQFLPIAKQNYKDSLDAIKNNPLINS